MSSVRNDFEQMRLFTERLNQYLDEINQANSNLDSAFNELGESWDDHKRKEFEEVYSDLRDMINRFRENAEEQIPYLHDMADKLEEYYNIRTRR